MYFHSIQPWFCLCLLIHSSQRWDFIANSVILIFLLVVTQFTVCLNVIYYLICLHSLEIYLHNKISSDDFLSLLVKLCFRYAPFGHHFSVCIYKFNELCYIFTDNTRCYGSLTCSVDVLSFSILALSYGSSFCLHRFFFFSKCTFFLPPRYGGCFCILSLISFLARLYTGSYIYIYAASGSNIFFATTAHGFAGIATAIVTDRGTSKFKFSPSLLRSLSHRCPSKSNDSSLLLTSYGLNSGVDGFYGLGQQLAQEKLNSELKTREP